MSTLIPSTFEIGSGDREPWLDDVKLFQPYEDGQILLPDFSNCLSVKTYLRMCHLTYQEDLRQNAEFISPTGKVPCLAFGKYLIADFHPIVTFVSSKGYNLSAHLSQRERADMRAYMSVIENQLVPAEIYLTWRDAEMYHAVTKFRHGLWYPWPLNTIIPMMERYKMNSLLNSTGWYNKTIEQVYAQVQQCCEVLSEKLGEDVYFFGDHPTELDALVYGHFFTLLTTELPLTKFADIVKGYDNLTAFCQRIDSQYFGKDFVQ